jgi:hypothetical protein
MCSFTYMSTETVAGNAPQEQAPQALTCPVAMPQHFCAGVPGAALAPAATKGSDRHGQILDTSPDAEPLTPDGLEQALPLGAPSLFFTSVVSLSEPGSLAAVPRSPPFLSGCRLRLKDAGSYVQLANSVRKECDVASTTWGGGCKCLEVGMWRL